MIHAGTSGTFVVFVIASVLLAVTPGPGVLYLLTRTLGDGRRAGLASVGGIALGNLGNALLACLGLGALLAISSRALVMLKLAGAAYLVWLGLEALRGRSRPAATAPRAAPSSRRSFRDATWVALLNPKTAIFYAAFVPQFIAPGAAAPLLQTLSLSVLFVAIAACTDTLYVLSAGALRSRLRRPGRGVWARRMMATVYLTLGVFVAFSDVRRGSG